jgi:phage terminase large subunit
MTNSELIISLRDKIVNKNAMIFADSAEPQRIEEIYKSGYNIHPAEKKVSDGIDFVKRFKLLIHSGSINLINEIKAYKWKEDKNGNTLDEPIKENDHLLDALRYCVYTYGKKHLNQNQYLFPKIKSKYIKYYEVI